ncbi:type IV pilin protein [Solemya velesiana gill symbiont]|uniref:type IV pilin protein n=1 Tax=Solemya velesiana gill symbiont TaxID=1918948 RepID=UPI001083D185|nr:type IV pilin protein [Solemya velesiana gill symbiont]
MKNVHFGKWQSGITLIELVIVVAIIGVLAGVGYPLYAEQVRKARRADAQGALYGFANAMEQHAATNPATGYAGAANGGGNTGAPDASVFPDEAPLDAVDKYYDLTISAVTMDGVYGTDFTLQAAPKGKMAGDACGNLTLTSAGVRGRSGGEGMNKCWR